MPRTVSHTADCARDHAKAHESHTAAPSWSLQCVVVCQRAWSFNSLFGMTFFACRCLVGGDFPLRHPDLIEWSLWRSSSSSLRCLSFSTSLSFISSPQNLFHWGIVTIQRACLHLTMILGEPKRQIWHSFLHWQGQVQCLDYRKYWINVWWMS